jgi:Importin beta binding domain
VGFSGGVFLCDHDNMADSTRYVPEHRRQTYKGKNLFKGDELRRRREEQQVEIRKQKKEENLAKRRNLTVGTDASMDSDTDDEGIAGINGHVCIFSVMI